MSFTVPRFPSLPFHRSVIEHWTYRWDQDQQRYIRATYRPQSVDEPSDNPREEIDQDPPAVAGLPQEESTTTSQAPPRFSGVRFNNPDFVVPVMPVTPTMTSATATAPLRPPVPAVRSPVTIRPNTSLGQRHFIEEGPGPSTGASGATQRGRSRNRASRSMDGSPLSSRSRWVSPCRVTPAVPDSPASPDPSPPQSPRTSPGIFPDSPPPSPLLLPAPIGQPLQHPMPSCRLHLGQSSFLQHPRHSLHRRTSQSLQLHRRTSQSLQLHRRISQSLHLHRRTSVSLPLIFPSFT